MSAYSTTIGTTYLGTSSTTYLVVESTYTSTRTRTRNHEKVGENPGETTFEKNGALKLKFDTSKHTVREAVAGHREISIPDTS